MKKYAASVCVGEAEMPDYLNSINRLGFVAETHCDSCEYEFDYRQALKR
jgi:hypothetical protein